MLPGAFRQRNSLVQTVERIRRLDLHLREEFRVGLFFDHQREVLHLTPEALRNQHDRLNDETFELGAGHGVSCPAGPLSGVTMVTTSSAGRRGPGDGLVRRAGGAGRR